MKLNRKEKIALLVSDTLKNREYNIEILEFHFDKFDDKRLNKILENDIHQHFICDICEDDATEIGKELLWLWEDGSHDKKNHEEGKKMYQRCHPFYINKLIYFI